VNPDFCDMLAALCAENAEFMIVGAYALAAHGLPRATGDIDIWVRSTKENAQNVWNALKRFRAPLSDLSLDDLQTPDVVFQIGAAPRRIDILTSISGVAFESAWPSRKITRLAGLDVPVIGRLDLLRNKRAAGRAQDLIDAQRLEDHPSD
jgi:hypothetical protein